MYSKLQQLKFLQKDKLTKFLVNKAQINSSQAKEIVTKGFQVSKEATEIDLAGFFYLMKYVAWIQNGGSEKDDITEVQKELPLAAMKESSKKSSESSEKQKNIQNKDKQEPKDNEKNNEKDFEEQKQNQDNFDHGQKINGKSQKASKEDFRFLKEQYEKNLQEGEMNPYDLLQSNISNGSMQQSGILSEEINQNNSLLLSGLNIIENSPKNIQDVQGKQNQIKQEEDDEQEEEKEGNLNRQKNNDGDQNKCHESMLREHRLITFGQQEEIKMIVQQFQEQQKIQDGNNYDLDNKPKINKQESYKNQNQNFIQDYQQFKEQNDGNLNSVYESKDFFQQDKQEINPFSNFQKEQKLVFLEQESQVIEEKKQNEQEDDDLKLIKSVSQVFQKEDQKQIQHAFDFFRSNREESILHKSKLKKEKNVKRVRITGHRNDYENFIKQYTLYQIETTVEGRKIIVERRYNNFRALHEYFENSVNYYGIIKPILPDKNMTSLGIGQYTGKMEKQTLDQRKIDLENYLNLYLQNEILKHDKVLTSFLEEKQFVPPVDTQFSYVEWVKKMVANVQDTDFSEWKDYTEAKMKITLNDFFKLGDNEVDTSDIDSKMEQVNQLGIQVNKIIDFLNNDIKYDNEQLNAIEQLERNFYPEYDQREQPQEDTLLEILKNFKSEILDHQIKVKVEIQEKQKVLQEFRIIHNSIESAKVAQQVLKNKIQERYILKNMKVSKFNKVHEQNNNRSDSSEAKRELEILNEKFQQSEDTIKHIQLKLSKELLTFIEIQREKISETLQMFSSMNKQNYVGLNK